MARVVVTRPTQNDEMCNLYVMYYAETLPGHSSQGHPSQLTCLGVDQPGLLASMPVDVVPPSRSDLEENTNQFSHRHHHLAGSTDFVAGRTL